MIRTGFPALFLLAAIGCGSEPPNVNPDGGVAPSLIPLQVGNEWRYRVTSGSGVVSEKINTVTGTKAVGSGETAFRLLTGRANQRGTTSLQIIRDGVLYRLEEQGYRNDLLVENDRYVPGSIRIDSNKVKTGDTYESRFTKQNLDSQGNVIGSIEVVNTFTVESGNEPLDVPAGRFNCVRVRRESNDETTKTYWYAPGLGKVKEIGGQTEELLQYSVKAQ